MLTRLNTILWLSTDLFLRLILTYLDVGTVHFDGWLSTPSAQHTYVTNILYIVGTPTCFSASASSTGVLSFDPTCNFNIFNNFVTFLNWVLHILYFVFYIICITYDIKYIIYIVFILYIIYFILDITYNRLQHKNIL